VVAAALMRGPFLRTGIAVAVLAVLGYFAWRESQKEPGAADKKAKVLTFERAKVKELRLQHAGGAEIKALRQGTFWRLATPLDAPAGASEIESLLVGFESLEVQEVVAETPGALAPYGLDPVKLSASLTLDGAAAPLTVLLGDATPDKSALYAKLPDQARLFLIPFHLASALDKQVLDLRDRDLLHVQRDAVRSLDVAGPEGDFRLARDAQGEWAIVAPLKTQAGRWSVDSLVGLLEGLRWDSVAAENASELGPFGLDKPTRRVTIGLADGSTKRLELGSILPDKKVHAREGSSAFVAVIPPALVDDLAKGFGELRAKRLMDVSTFDVESLDVRVDGQARSYARTTTKSKDGVETSQWKQSTPAAKDLETTKVEDVLFKLTGLETQAFVDHPKSAADYGLDSPELTVTLKLSGGRTRSVTIGRKDGVAHARRDGDDAVLRLDAAKLDEALKELRAL
jgi:hypothetical protein